MESILDGGITYLWENLSKLKDKVGSVQLAFMLDMIDGVETRIENFAEIAQLLLNKFCPPLTTSEQETLAPVHQAVNYSLSLLHTNNFSFITLEELNYHLKTRRSRAASVLDGFPIVLKHTWDIVGPHLVFLFNCSLACSHLFGCWKKGKLIVIPKTSKFPGLAAQLRPLTLLISFSKLLEVVVDDRIQKFYEQKRIFYEGQFGF